MFGKLEKQLIESTIGELQDKNEIFKKFKKLSTFCKNDIEQLRK